VHNTLVFVLAALAILPIAALIEQSTEQLSAHTGDAVGGLLNATFGNAPELIAGLVALKAGCFDAVRATMLAPFSPSLWSWGSLPVRRPAVSRSGFSASASRVYSSMMFIAVMARPFRSGFGRLFALAGSPEAMVRQEYAEHWRRGGAAFYVFTCFHAKDAPGTSPAPLAEESHEEEVGSGDWGDPSEPCSGRRCWWRG
jgi:hypothetical protein